MSPRSYDFRSSAQLIDEYDEAHDEIYAVMQTLPIPERPAPLEHSVITILVTEHGLCDFMADIAGVSPAMAA